MNTSSQATGRRKGLCFRADSFSRQRALCVVDDNTKARTTAPACRETREDDDTGNRLRDGRLLSQYNNKSFIYLTG